MKKRDLNICLVKIAEECGEVVQIACKSFRYGLANLKPGKSGTNRELLIEELGDVVAYMRLLIEDTDCGICVNPHNPNEIADAITYLINNPTDAERLGKNGKNALATNIENIFPKFELAVIFIYLIIFP